MATTQYTTDQIEIITTELLTKAKRSGYFAECIADAEWLQESEGYVWDVALAIAVKYWAR